MLIDFDKAFDWLTTSRDVNAEFKGIGLLYTTSQSFTAQF